MCRHHFASGSARFNDNAYRRIICTSCSELADGALRKDWASIEAIVDRPTVTMEARAALRSLKARADLSRDAKHDIGRIERMLGFRQRKEARP